MRTYTRLIVLGLAALMLVGCGDTPEVKLERAKINLTQGKADRAVSLAYEVLDLQPDNQDAMLVLAKGQMQLVQMDVAWKTLQSVVKADAGSVEARRAMSQWVFVRISTLLGQTDFTSSAELQQQFDDAILEGQKLADWYETKKQDKAEANILRARLAESEAGKISALLKEYKKKLNPNVVKRPGEELKDDDLTTVKAEEPVVKRFERQIDARHLDAEEYCRKVLDADGGHVEAIRMYATLLARRKGWEDLWQLATKISKQKQLVEAIAERIAVLLLMMPDDQQPLAKRVELSWALQNIVPEEEKKSLMWKSTSARLHLALKKADEARPLLEDVLAAQPMDENARYLMAQVYFEQEQYDKAKEILSKLATSRRVGGASEVHLLYALTLMKLGQNAMALESAKRAQDLAPDDPMVQRVLAALMVSNAQGLAPAADQINKIYDTNSSDVRAIRIKIQYEQANDRPKAVEQVLETTSRLKALTDEHLKILIDGYNYLQKYDVAERYARQLVQERPDSMDSHFRLAEALLYQNKDDDVKAIVATIRQKFPDAASTDELLGRLYLQRQSFKEAHQLLRGVVEREPENVEARILLARTLASMALTEEALEQLDRVRELDPTNVAMHSLAARVYQFTGQQDKAEQELAQIGVRDVDEGANPALKAQLLLKQEKLDEAAAVCNRAIASGNVDPMLRMMLANIYLKQEKPDQAEVHLLALVKRQPDNPQAYQLLARFYLQQKNIRNGLLELKKLQTANETLSRLAQAMVLSGVRQYDEALVTLAPMYHSLAKTDDRMAMGVADAMAKIYIAKGDRTRAFEVYDVLLENPELAGIAVLRRIEMTWNDDDDATRLAKLNALAAMPAASDYSLRQQIMRRLMAIHKADRVVELLDQWIAKEPKQTLLLRWKAEHLVQTGKPDEAIDTLKKAIEIDPQNKRLRQELAKAHIVQFDYAGGEQVYREMAKIDQGAKIVALSDLGMMYVGLGLHKQAVRTFDELESIGRSHDPRIIAAMGRARAALGQDQQAMDRLKDVPFYASQYASSQVLLARLEQRNAQVDQARTRLEELVGNPRTAVAGAGELLGLNLTSPDMLELMRWSDAVIAIESLPDPVRNGWLAARVKLEASQKNWKGVLQSLERLQDAAPDSLRVTLSRITVMWRLNQIEQARALFQSNQPLLKSAMGPPMAAALGFKPNAGTPLVGGLPGFLQAMSVSNVEAARAAINTVPPLQTVFGTDLIAMLDRPDISSPNMSDAARRMLIALIAREVGLSALAAELCEDLVQKMPALTLAHALLVQSLSDINKNLELERAADRVRKNGRSALVQYVDMVTASRKGDHLAAADAARKLLAIEPANFFVAYSLAQQLQLAKKLDDAIAVLQDLSRQNGPLSLVARNDLAYTLAEQHPDQLDTAYALATKAFSDNPKNMPLLDTVGWLEHLRGDNVAALNHLTKAIIGLNNLPEVHYHLGVVYKALKNPLWARYHLEEAAGGPADKHETAEAKELLATLSAAPTP